MLRGRIFIVQAVQTRSAAGPIALFAAALLVLAPGCEGAKDSAEEAADPGDAPFIGGCTVSAEYVLVGDDTVYTSSSTYDGQERPVSEQVDAEGIHYSYERSYATDGCMIATSASFDSSYWSYRQEMSYSCDEHATEVYGSGSLAGAISDGEVETGGVLYEAVATYDGDVIRSFSNALTYDAPWDDYSSQGGYVNLVEDGLVTQQDTYYDYDRARRYGTETWRYDDDGEYTHYTKTWADLDLSMESDVTRDEWGRAVGMQQRWSSGLESTYEAVWAEDTRRLLSTSWSHGDDGEVDEEVSYTWHDEVWPWAFRVEQDGAYSISTSGEIEGEAAHDGVVDAWTEWSWSCP